jgi:hypothetical protein
MSIQVVYFRIHASQRQNHLSWVPALMPWRLGAKVWMMIADIQNADFLADSGRIQ